MSDAPQPTRRYVQIEEPASTAKPAAPDATPGAATMRHGQEAATAGVGTATAPAAPPQGPADSGVHSGNPYAAAASHPAAQGPQGPHGKQLVKFSFYRLKDDVRALPEEERYALGGKLAELLQASSQQMLTRTYTTVGTRADVDFLVWQVSDDLPVLQDWHAALLRSSLGAAFERPHAYLSMTMRSQYANLLHPEARGRETLRDDGYVDDYLFVYPMIKTRAWYALPQDARQRIMTEHIAIGHKYHGVKINTTYSYGLDDQEFVVAFEGNSPGEFLALVRELRDSEASSYTLVDTPMFTCRRMPPDALLPYLGLLPD